MTIAVQRRKTGNVVQLRAGDQLVYDGRVVDLHVLEAILGDDGRRLLWAFLRNDVGDIQATPYSEDQVIWMQPSDVLKERDVEL